MREKTDSTILIFDFDSTIVTIEALDELATIALADAPDKSSRVAAIRDITERGMNGELGFSESLALRFEQIMPTKQHLAELILLLQNSISPSFLAHKDFIRENAENIWVVSGGFSDFIVPIVSELGIKPSHVLANEFIWNGETATSYHHDNPLSKSGGKIAAIQRLSFPSSREIIMVGDGLTDYSVRGVGLADKFIAYIETIEREPTVAVADMVARSFGDVLNVIEM